MNRTTIFLTENGSLLIQREVSTGLSGNGAQRRKLLRSGWQPDWRVIDRVITRDIRKLPEKAMTWLQGFVPEDNHLNAGMNDYIAQLHVEQAQRTVEQIHRAEANFHVDQTVKRWKLVWDFDNLEELGREL